VEEKKIKWRESASKFAELMKKLWDKSNSYELSQIDKMIRNQNTTINLI
jgi:hypothetical protein